jgi:hypothetical protein
MWEGMWRDLMTAIGARVSLLAAFSLLFDAREKITLFLVAKTRGLGS